MNTWASKLEIKWGGGSQGLSNRLIIREKVLLLFVLHM